MDRQLKFNYSFTFPFNVINRLDLNHEGVEIRKPLKGEISKKFFLGFGSSAMNISAEIPIRGFACGQTLAVSVELVNESSVDVERILVELHKKTLFKCNGISTKTGESQMLVKGTHDGVAGKSKAQMTFSFAVPEIEPTNVKFCKYINMTYELAIIAEVKGLHRNLVLTIPITIGTIPLTGFEAASTSEPPPTYEYALNADNEKVQIEDQKKNLSE